MSDQITARLYVDELVEAARNSKTARLRFTRRADGNVNIDVEVAHNSWQPITTAASEPRKQRTRLVALGTVVPFRSKAS